MIAKEEKFMDSKKLYRSQHNKMIAGVCGGLGDFFNIDATIIRLVWAIFCLSGAGIIAYILAAVIMPVEPEY